LKQLGKDRNKEGRLKTPAKRNSEKTPAKKIFKKKEKLLLKMMQCIHT